MDRNTEQRLIAEVPKSLVAAVDGYCHERGLGTRRMAVIRLLEAGLNMEPQPLPFRLPVGRPKRQPHATTRA